MSGDPGRYESGPEEGLEAPLLERAQSAQAGDASALPSPDGPVLPSVTEAPVATQGFKHRHPKRSTLRTVCPYILSNEFCERLAYYGLATNLVTYITVVIGGDAGFAAVMVAIFEGACYTTPLLGAVCADSMWGRYKTILVFSFVYLVGICLLTLSSWPPFGSVPGPDQKPDWLDYSMLCTGLGVIALGTGGIKPNVSSFGADQFNPANPQDVKEKESFFNYFYMTINVGSLLACTLVVYVQDQISWTLGFAIPGFAMVVSIIVFWMGRRVYVHVLPTESPMVRVYNVVSAALRNKMKKRRMPPPPPPPLAGDAEAESGGDDGIGEPKERRSDALQADSATTSYRWLEDAITEWQTDRQARQTRVGGRAGYTLKQVEEVKLVLRLLPVFFCCILYWTIYTQMSAMFVTQGNNMHRSFEWNGQGFKIPAASMAVFNTVSIIALIWVYDMMLEPGLSALGYKMTMLRRCGWGMVIAALTMANAAGVEWWRLKVYREEFCIPCGNGHGHHGSDYSTGECGCEPGTPSLSIFWQAPQYVLIGLSEVFTSIAQIEFFYDQAPDVMRSCSMALGLLSSALGSYMAGILTWVVQTFSQTLTGSAWLPKDLNQGRLDLFFLLMMVLMVANTAAFVMVAINYQYKTVEHKETRARHVKAAPMHLRSRSSPQVLESLVVPPQWIAGPAAAQPMPFPSASQPMAIGRRTPFTNVVPAESSDEEGDEDVEQYSRSLTYQPFLKTRGAPH